MLKYTHLAGQAWYEKRNGLNRWHSGDHREGLQSHLFGELLLDGEDLDVFVGGITQPYLLIIKLLTEFSGYGSTGGATDFSSRLWLLSE